MFRSFDSAQDSARMVLEKLLPDPVTLSLSKPVLSPVEGGDHGVIHRFSVMSGSGGFGAQPAVLG